MAEPGVRQRVPNYTREQFSRMDTQEKKDYVDLVMKEVKEAKKALQKPETKQAAENALAYLYKSLPAEMKTQKMKEEILPYDFSAYKKAPGQKKGGARVRAVRAGAL